MRTLDPIRALVAIAVAVASPAAFAHPGHGDPQDLWQGFLHPIGGLDHLLAMVAVGLIAARLDGRALWSLPASFLAAMAVAGACGMAGLGLPDPETGIALSLVAFGLLVALPVRYPIAGLAGIVALFALFHGYAHGVEAAAAGSGLVFGLGFLITTGLLHLAGIGLGMAMDRLDRRRFLSGLGGGAIAMAGLAILGGGSLM